MTIEEFMKLVEQRGFKAELYPPFENPLLTESFHRLKITNPHHQETTEVVCKFSTMGWSISQEFLAQAELPVIEAEIERSLTNFTSVKPAEEPQKGM